jgi:hypothetical protein
MKEILQEENKINSSYFAFKHSSSDIISATELFSIASTITGSSEKTGKKYRKLNGLEKEIKNVLHFGSFRIQ